MKTTEVNNSIIGKRCECMFTGMLVTGTIVDIEENQHTADVKVRYDQPHQWGDCSYTEGWSWDRKHDEFGTLKHLSIIPFDTLSVVFAKPIREVERMFQDTTDWGVSSLRSWINSYESTRFTQTGTHTALITSEYNMECVKEWLIKNTPIATITEI